MCNGGAVTHQACLLYVGFTLSGSTYTRPRMSSYPTTTFFAAACFLA